MLQVEWQEDGRGDSIRQNRTEINSVCKYALWAVTRQTSHECQKTENDVFHWLKTTAALTK